MRITVTGAAGQLGRALARRARDVELRGLGSGELDITDGDAATRVLQGSDVVINCAAYTAVDRAETDEERAFAVNALGARALAAACARVDARLIHVSTDYVFDGTATDPYETDGTTGPATAYGRTKLAGELAVHEELPSAHVVRTAWVYTGEGTDFVATMRRLERERDTIDVVDDQLGSPTYADDLADGLLELAEHPEAPPLLHLTNAGVASWYDLARATFELLDADPARVRPCTSAEFVRPAPRPAYSVLSNRVWTDAGLTPLRDWRAGLRAALTGD
ncbi:dTDP-4-dehydrorhamnose reductase [Aldersonia sp. NBC_00410]|uniref:dTDP-4-dehydrorhamnose reductase n=1 Tax=Aldersonia sp. NBC_00410 TaxID=2975954 RepID=UPI00225BD58E|nr:dTDP-4-dehydrorhamnose reductase [Aldersonia sp. NBC_00410]MCX5044526.1 dTDP-4-dehydrorhamnose reductase [Aldersonia sp. NBC_00410]